MKFSIDKNLSFDQAVELMFDKLGDWKIMALASSVNDYVMVRNVSCLFYDEKVYLFIILFPFARSFNSKRSNKHSPSKKSNAFSLPFISWNISCKFCCKSSFNKTLWSNWLCNCTLLCLILRTRFDNEHILSQKS